MADVSNRAVCGGQGRLAAIAKRLPAPWRRPALLLLLLVAFVSLFSATQPEEPASRLEIATIDDAAFPSLGVNLIVTGTQSRPKRDMSGLRLRENGVPIADYQLQQVPVGSDVFFVLDANERIQDVEDESGLTRMQKVRDSILNYAGRFMDVAGRDHVTVIVPGDDGGRLLVDDVTDPAALITALRNYDPQGVEEPPTLAMLELALEEAAERKEAGRFQAIVLITDGGGLNRFLFPPLVEEAQTLQVPLFALLMGLKPSESVLETISWLTVPTRGFHAAMSEASESTGIYQVLQDNGTQSQVRYQSNLSESGSYSIVVSVDDSQDEETLELNLAAPEVTLTLPQNVIRRRGTGPETPLADLQPATQPLTARVSWPDRLPRRIEAVALLADGRPQTAPVLGGSDDLQFEWDISGLDAGRYALSVVVTDTLGFSAQSSSEVVIVEISRPETAPTPVPTATPSPLAALRQLLPAREGLMPLAVTLGGALFVLLAGAALLSRLHRRGQQDDAASSGTSREEELPEPGAEGAGPVPKAWLEKRGEDTSPLPLEGTSVTIGRDAQEVGLRLDDESVSGLHARIRYRGGKFWLYDEGSAGGTFLNYERLGLTPKVLEDGDEIQLGRVRMRFRQGSAAPK